jgi:hypothetical protein
VVTFPLPHQTPVCTFPPLPSVLGMDRPGRHFRDSYLVPSLRICGCVPPHPLNLHGDFLMDKKKHCGLHLITKRGVNFYVCSSTRWRFVQICTKAHYLSGNSFRFTLPKISWADASARIIAVWKKDFLTVSIIEFSDLPALTIWVTNTIKATLIYIKPCKIMDILMVNS